MPQAEGNVQAIQFPYFRDGKTVNIKYRDLKKNFRLEKGAEPIVYKIDDITFRAGEVVIVEANATLPANNAKGEIIICEGEIDALSFEEIGIRRALSLFPRS